MVDVESVELVILIQLSSLAKKIYKFQESWSAYPKLFEKGGRYYTGRTVRTYRIGSIINVHVEVWSNGKYNL